jgi:small-conductance mechanosensitive channel
MLSLLSIAFANDDPLTLSKDIDAMNDKVLLSQASPRALYQIRVNLRNYRNEINQCIAEYQDRYDFIQEKLKSISSWQNNAYLEKKYQFELTRLKEIEGNLNICKFAKFNAERLHNMIFKYTEINFIKSFDTKYDSFLKIVKEVNVSTFVYLPRGYVLKMLIQHSNFKRNMSIFMGILFLFLFIKIYQMKVQPKNIFFPGFELKHFFQMLLIFLFISPVQYLSYKTSYIHYNELLLDIYKKPSSIMLSVIVFLYLLKNYDRAYFKKDIMLIIPSVFIVGLLLSCCFAINYFDLNNISYIQTMFFKYSVLILQYCILFLMYYWLFVRILQLKIFYGLFFKAYVLIATALLIVGLHGYVDMAVSVNFSILFFESMCVFVSLFTLAKLSLVDEIMKPSPKLENLMVKLYGTERERVILNLKLLINFVYISVIAEVALLAVISSVFFFYSHIIYDIYLWIYSQKSIGAYNFVIINYIYAVLLFLVLNIINYAISTYLAKKFFEDPILKQKTTQFFHMIGVLITLMICLVVTEINIHNIVLLFGGLLLGIGFGLKNILTNILSSALIYINRPFELGDYIGIGNYKGYVSKIGILETAIKTEDSDVVILPNQNIASSIIQNYTFNNKKHHKVHVKYIIMDMTEQDELKIRKIILEILTQDENVLTDQEKYYQFLFSADTQNIGAFQLELVFTVNTLRYMKQITNDINLKIIDELKKENIELRFVSISHALVSTS